MLNLFQLSRSQITLTLLSELHSNHLVAELVSLGFGLGFLYLVFGDKTLDLFEKLGQSLVLTISRTEFWFGPESGQSRGDRLGSAVRLFPRLRGGERFLHLRLFTNRYKALVVLAGSPVGHGSPHTAGSHQNSEANFILTTTDCDGGGRKVTWTWAGEVEEEGHSGDCRVSGKVGGPGEAPALSPSRRKCSRKTGSGSGSGSGSDSDSEPSRPPPSQPGWSSRCWAC